MNEEQIKEYIVSELEKIDKKEEKIRLGIVTFVLANKELLDRKSSEISDDFLQLIENIKDMNSKQLELIDLLNEQFLYANSSEDEFFLEIINDKNTVLKNVGIEFNQLQSIWLLSSLYNISDNEWLLIKKQIEYTFGPYCPFDITSKNSLILNLLNQNKKNKNKFYDNYQKVKRRKEISDE